MAARQRLDQVASIARDARKAGPPCSECRFRKLSNYCGNPAYAEPGFNPAAGTYVEKFTTSVAEARSEDGLCGPEALLFEPAAPFVRTIPVVKQTMRALALYVLVALSFVGFITIAVLLAERAY